jgi:EAL domain-containing protein (putative c-di-GMP-specific phosphodiesterase class I)
VTQPDKQTAEARVKDFDPLMAATTDNLSRWGGVGSGFAATFGGFHNWNKRRVPPDLKLRPCRFLKFPGRRVDVTNHGASDNLFLMPPLSSPRDLPSWRQFPAEGERPRLLLVEDDDSLRDALTRALTDTFEVTAVADGNAAAALLVGEPYDGVLSDIRLPGMSGVDLLKLVRSYDLDVPVVLMTAQPSIETAVAALDLGALTYIQKPFSHAELRQTALRAARLARIARTKRDAVEAGVAGSPLAGDIAGLHASLERALDSVCVHFQPIVARKTQETIGFEALVRTREPSMPNPGTLIEAAERLGRIHELGRRVREVAAATFKPPSEDMLLFVNLHPKDLLDPDLFATAAPLTQIANHVVLEITERAAIDDVTDTRHRSAELRRRGFRLAIDDLGAGYAGLASFATLEPEVVKLDMSLIRGIESSTVKRQVVSSMTRLCRDLDMRVVAEGIESSAELETIVSLGCDYVQGYLLGRPGPALSISPHSW